MLFFIEKQQKIAKSSLKSPKEKKNSSSKCIKIKNIHINVKDSDKKVV